MDDARFWRIIEKACKSDPELADEWDERLEAALGKLPAEEIVAFGHLFEDQLSLAETVDLWGAAYLINGGASDDGFYYFRCWLVCMGRAAFEKALADPDSLADVVEPDMIAESETYTAAHHAWMAVTGRPDLDEYPAHPDPSSELRGEDWDFDDEEECRKRLPRLSGLYLQE